MTAEVIERGDDAHLTHLLALTRQTKRASHDPAAIVDTDAQRADGHAVLFGRAGDDFTAQLAALKPDWHATVILIDIEGAEFGLLNEELLTLTRGARYVVELHDTYQADPSARLSLLARLAPHWKTEVIVDRARDWHGIEQLRKWHDLDRAVLVSEGRKLIGEWLVAEPK